MFFRFQFVFFVIVSVTFFDAGGAHNIDRVTAFSSGMCSNRCGPSGKATTGKLAEVALLFRPFPSLVNVDHGFMSGC